VGVERRPVELGALAEEVARTLAPPGVSVEVRADGEALAWADAARLRQALENLVGNALEHSPDGMPVELAVTTEARDDGAWATVAVRDRGPGLPAELRPRLFERFAAGPGSRGLGLGLYLARQIAEAHGGTLRADDAPGAGAHFTLALPAGRPPDAAEL
jgi:two-component system, OmpR family, sensor kinase